MRTHPAVREAVVLAREDGRGEARLVAYVVPVPPHTLTPEALYRFLAAALPAAILPTVFVLLEALPLTPNGKVDRRALPAPDTLRPALATVFVPPRTPIEERLVKIWAEILNLQQVGIHDNFLALGGHSLLAMQVLSRLRDTFQVELTVRSFFEAPTVASLAKTIELARQTGQHLAVPPAATAGSGWGPAALLCAAAPVVSRPA